jgi:predicted porin
LFHRSNATNDSQKIHVLVTHKFNTRRVDSKNVYFLIYDIYVFSIESFIYEIHRTQIFALYRSRLDTGCSAFAQVAPSVTLYGRMDLGLESVNNGDFNKTMLQNYASRFGIKGDRSFSSDLTGLFQVETAFSPDDGKNENVYATASTGNVGGKQVVLKTGQTTGYLGSRNTFVGLKSNSIGTALFGNYDTPLKSLDGGGVASTLWGEGDAMEVIIHGKGTATSLTKPADTTLGSTATATLFANVHTRQNNNLVYISPKFADTVVKVSYSPDEAQTATTNQPLYSASVEWNNGTYNAGFATQTQQVSTADYAMTANKFTLGAIMGNFSAGLIFSTLDNQAPDATKARKTNNSMITLGYTDAAWAYKFNYAMSSESASGAADDLTMTALEADYTMDKATALYVGYAQIMNNKHARGTFTAADNFPNVTAGQDPTALTFGIRYNF